MPDIPSQTSPLAPGRTDVLPGYTLSPLPLMAYAELEDEFARRHVATLVGGAVAVNPNDWERAMRLASEEVYRVRVGIGSAEFDSAVQAYGSVPVLLYLSLRVRHPKMTREIAAGLITDDNFRAIRNALLELLGFVFFDVTGASQTTTGSGEPTTSATSPADSAPVDSDTQKSAA